MAKKAKAVEDQKELYTVVYADCDVNGKDLETYFNDRNQLKYTPYIKISEMVEDEETKILVEKIRFEALPKINYTSFDVFKSKWNYTGSIYKLVENQTFTVILFDSRDYDSVLCKDIIVKQYDSVYARHSKDWRISGVIIYDVYKQESLYETYEGTNYFDLNCLTETKVDEVFLCGYVIDSNLFKQFARSGEKIFVFENNPYKINSVRSVVKASYDIHYCMSKTTNKAYQAYTLFRDPIGNIKIEDNKGFEILKKYSDINNKSFQTCEEWEELEQVKVCFEEKIKDKDWRENLVDVLFGVENKKIDDFNPQPLDGNGNALFEADLIDYSYKWTNNTIVINTRQIPTFKQVKDIISDQQLYSQIITFFKDDTDFWTLRAYKTDREIPEGIHCDDVEPVDEDGLQITWYTKTGVPVIKVVSYDKVKWFNVSGKRPVEINGYEQTTLNPEKTEQTIYAFDLKNKKYVVYANGTEADGETNFETDDLLTLSNKTVKKFIKSEKTPQLDLSELYRDTSIIDFNSLSLINILRNKYYCQGNKFTVTASLTDRQMYECLKTKSLLG